MGHHRTEYVCIYNRIPALLSSNKMKIHRAGGEMTLREGLVEGRLLGEGGALVEGLGDSCLNIIRVFALVAKAAKRH